MKPRSNTAEARRSPGPAVNYKDPAAKEQSVVFEFDKDDIRPALAIFKARSGKDITFTDDEARKQMGGGVPAKEEKKAEDKKQ
jgi:hypothetical protein